MNDEYLEAFVRESEENIVDLNNALLTLEDDPTDQESLDLIFRTAHTLKGNFSAMGFERTSNLAHAIEDLLDEVRHDRLEITPDRMDLVFEGVDMIETALEEIEADGEVSIDPGSTIDAIRSGIESASAVDESDEATDAEEGASDAGGEKTTDLDREALSSFDLDELSDVSPPVTHVRAELEESDMPGVDGMLVLEELTDALDVVATDPQPDDIDDGDFGGEIEVIVAGDDTSTVEAAIDEVGDVASAVVTEITDDLAEEPASGAETASSDGDDGGVREDAVDDLESRGSSTQQSPTSVDEIKSVRIDVDQLDELYGLVEQLVTSRIKLRRAVEAQEITATDDNLDELDKISSSLQATVMDMRMIPLKKVVNTFPRMVRDLAREQDKELDFGMENTDIELDRTILDEISDPLMHVLRNAIDHGIEPPAEREDADKPREGTIRLRAHRERDHIEIVVEDDGQGLDVDRIREEAVEKGVHTEDELAAMADTDIYDLIFHPGFSTNEEVTDVSGRGVGMDVVKKTVNKLDGSVSVESDPGQGTTVTLRLPVTVAIVRVLFIEVGDREYGIPIKSIDEISQVSNVRTVDGTEVLEHDDAIYPVVRLREALDAGQIRENGSGMIVRIREQERQIALRCDEVTRQEEVVIKPFVGELSNVHGLSGTAVVGDGNVIPIIDVGTLERHQ